MTSTKNQMFVGYEIGTGEPVYVPVFHSLFTGQTQLSGKTTALKALAKQVVKQGYKVLVIDTKTNYADYVGFGQEVPVCLQYSTDTLVLRNLLESINERKLTIFQGTLTRVTEDSTTYEEVVEKLEATEKKARSDFIKDACHMLANLLHRLIEQTKKVETTSELRLPYDINRMSINQFELQGQQLIIRSIFKEALRKFQKLVIILDESYKFLPQKYTSACQGAIQEYVTQGAITEDFLWESTQFLAPTNKDSMKAMPIKFLGTQDHITECEHTYALMPSPPRGLIISYKNGQAFTLQKADTIMNLKVGHFIVVTKETTKAVYVVPDGAERSDCLEVALGNLEPKEIHYVYSLVQTSEEHDQIAKASGLIKQPKTEPLTKKLEPPQPPAEPEKNIHGPAQPPSTESPPSSSSMPHLETRTESPPAPQVATAKEPEPSPPLTIPVTQEDLEKFKKQMFAEISAMLTTSAALQKPSAQPALPETATLEHPKTTVRLEIPVKHVTLNTDTVRGKVLYLGSLGILNDWKPLREVFNALVDQKFYVEYNNVKNELPKMAADGWLGIKIASNNQNSYSLSPNIVFETAKV